MYEEHDWASAKDSLILVHRRDPNFEPARVEHMLVTSYVSLAAEAIVDGKRWTVAKDYIDKALVFQQDSLAAHHDSEELQALSAALEMMTTATEAERSTAEENLQAVLVRTG